MKRSILPVDLQNELHTRQLIKLLNDYMCDPMGKNAEMEEGFASKIIAGLKAYTCYLGFFVLLDDQFAGLANCNHNFSTFKAKPILNIHDFIITPEFRNIDAGQFLLAGIINFASQNGYCRINLEVREDNLNAKSLYKKMGFSDCVPRMMFWERML